LGGMAGHRADLEQAGAAEACALVGAGGAGVTAIGDRVALAIPRLFPPPWIVVRISNGWCVRDANGQPIAFTYGDDTVQDLRPRPMTIDEAREIAEDIVKLGGGGDQ
jgi:hypothetical protein